MTFHEFVNWLNDDVAWGPLLLVLLFGTGLYLSIRTRFVQFRKLGFVLKNTIGKAFKNRGKTAKGEISPWQAVTTALAATIGTGNIAGVAGAVALGGPGAVFWMWLSSLLGMVTKFSEVVLAVKYRERNERGERVGGPMYYIKNGLGPRWKWLAVVFAAIASLATLGTGNATQVNSIASSVSKTIDVFGGNSQAVQLTFLGQTFSLTNLIVGIVLMIITALVTLWGLEGIGKITEKLVPSMSVIYVVSALVVVCMNFTHIGEMFGLIFSCAFKPEAALGGAAGLTIMSALQNGVSRGCFSNEAGLGSAPIAHASTSETDPVKQGMYGIFEVFMTLIICTLTALVVLSGYTSGGIEVAWGSGADGTLVADAIGSFLGAKLGVLIVSVCLTLFALSTIISWSLYGARCFEFLFGRKVGHVYKLFFVFVIMVGAIMSLEDVWSLASALNGFMAIPNLIGIVLLSPVVIKLTKEFFDNRK